MSDAQYPHGAGSRVMGDAIRELRETRGWTQYELARRADVHRATVMRAEKGEIAVAPATITKLAVALGVEPIFLLEKAGLVEDQREGVRESRLRYIISRAEEALDWLPEEFGDRMLDQLGDVLEAYRAFAMFLRRDSSEGEAERRDAPGETDRIDSLILRELRQLRQESEAEYQARVDALRSLIAEHESRINQQDAPGER
jgi:transcriptional regulator with XRE-family HTH domain